MTDTEYKVSNIVWDTDGEKPDPPLPVEYVIPSDQIEDALEAVDWLSDKFGWCIFSLHVEKIVPSNNNNLSEK